MGKKEQAVMRVVLDTNAIVSACQYGGAKIMTPNDFHKCVVR